MRLNDLRARIAREQLRYRALPAASHWARAGHRLSGGGVGGDFHVLQSTAQQAHFAYKALNNKDALHIKALDKEDTLHIKH